MIKLQAQFRYFCCVAILAFMGIFLAFASLARPQTVFADDENLSESAGVEHFVTIYDDGASLTVKTTATTVGEALERAEISLSSADIVDPGIDTPIFDNNFKINIYRARPVLVIDGVKRSYVMTASYDPKTVANEAGLTIYDGDEIFTEINRNFLEAGAVTTFRVQRNGGRTLTIEEVIPYETEIRYDFNLAKGERYLEQAGEEGRRISVYAVEFENNLEVSRELISEEVTVEPVKEIIIMGSQVEIPKERQQCATWAREAGVGEEDLEVALELIYHESSCRVDATNASSGAYGIPQALPKSKLATAGEDWETNPVTQIRWMINYVNTRYGGWHQAMDWWWEHRWY